MASTTKTQTVEAEVTIETHTHIKHESLTAALAAFQAEVPTIRKGNEARVNSEKGSYKYQYADLSDVTEKAFPLLGKHGLSFSALPTLDEANGFILQYALRHVSGDLAIGIYPLPDPRHTSPQQLGAAITYARRYTLCAVTGIAPGGDDDDAHSAPPAVAQSGPRPAPQKAEPSQEWLNAAKAATTKEDADKVWADLRAAVKNGKAPLATLDAVAAIWSERKAAADQEQAGEPEPTETEAPANAEEAAA